MTDTPTPVAAASERRGPFEVDTRAERIFEIRALAEVRAFGNGSGADMALRDLLALVDKQAAELARCEGNSRANMQYAAQNLTDRILKLQAFKDYVHQRLDEAGIPKEPNGEHSKAGCRVGDRLDIALLPQPDRAKATTSLSVRQIIDDLHDFRSGTRTPTKDGDGAIIEAVALIRTLSARAEAAEAECARLTSELAGITDRIMERITNAHDQGYREATNAAEARAETARAALDVPRVWRSEETDGMIFAFDRASKHGMRERMIAVGAWLLRHRQQKLTAPPPTAKEG